MDPTVKELVERIKDRDVSVIDEISQLSDEVLEKFDFFRIINNATDPIGAIEEAQGDIAYWESEGYEF